MGLHQNGFRDNCGVFRYAGAGVSNGAYPSTLPINTHLTGAQRNITAGQGITDDKVGIPLGYLAGASWLLPQKPGNMSARYTATASFTATGLAVGGVTADAITSFAIVVADAAGELISSGSGSATLTISVTPPLLTASISGAGSASFTLASNSPLLGAEANVIGSATLAITGAITPYAIGSMSGTTQEISDLTPAGIAGAVRSELSTELARLDVAVSTRATQVTAEKAAQNAALAVALVV